MGILTQLLLIHEHFPLFVFSLNEENSIARAAFGEPIGTTVTP